MNEKTNGEMEKPALLRRERKEGALCSTEGVESTGGRRARFVDDAQIETNGLCVMAIDREKGGRFNTRHTPQNQTIEKTHDPCKGLEKQSAHIGLEGSKCVWNEG